jgi:hypothetical protein
MNQSGPYQTPRWLQLGQDLGRECKVVANVRVERLEHRPVFLGCAH